MEVVVKNLIGICTIIDGKVNILTENNDLLTIICKDSIEEENQKYIEENLKVNNLCLKQCYTFSEKKEDVLTISILYVDIVNDKDIKSGKFNLIPIEKINNNKYVCKLLEYLKKEIVLNSTIKKIYPGEFILPEVQKVYEEILYKKYDRRNFRKKLLKLDVIEDINKISNNKKGRPAKLYKFKNITEDKILF